MESSIRKEDYIKIYKILDKVSPLNYDCGKLCNSACCICEDENTKDKDMVIYLLPGEELIFEDKIKKNESNWFEMDFDSTEKYDYPQSWNGNVYFIRCKNPPICKREIRPIQCRTFPLTPHLSEIKDSENENKEKDNKNKEYNEARVKKSKKLNLIYLKDDSSYECPLINKNIKLNQDFIETTYKIWEKLIKDPLIYDLIEMDSIEIINNKLEYKIII